jgi:hypothetical protein
VSLAIHARPAADIDGRHDLSRLGPFVADGFLTTGLFPMKDHPSSRVSVGCLRALSLVYLL